MSEATTKQPYILPFWFKQRQCKVEAQGETVLKIVGPNLGDAFLELTPFDGGWKAQLRRTVDGGEVAAAETPEPTIRLAWDVAFELYRVHVIT